MNWRKKFVNKNYKNLSNSLEWHTIIISANVVLLLLLTNVAAISKQGEQQQDLSETGTATVVAVDISFAGEENLLSSHRIAYDKSKLISNNKGDETETKTTTTKQTRKVLNNEGLNVGRKTGTTAINASVERVPAQEQEQQQQQQRKQEQLPKQAHASVVKQFATTQQQVYNEVESTTLPTSEYHKLVATTYDSSIGKQLRGNSNNKKERRLLKIDTQPLRMEGQERNESLARLVIMTRRPQAEKVEIAARSEIKAGENDKHNEKYARTKVKPLQGVSAESEEEIGMTQISAQATNKLAGNDSRNLNAANMQVVVVKKTGNSSETVVDEATGYGRVNMEVNKVTNKSVEQMLELFTLKNTTMPRTREVFVDTEKIPEMAVVKGKNANKKFKAKELEADAGLEAVEREIYKSKKAATDLVTAADYFVEKNTKKDGGQEKSKKEAQRFTSQPNNHSKTAEDGTLPKAVNTQLQLQREEEVLETQNAKRKRAKSERSRVKLAKKRQSALKYASEEETIYKAAATSEAALKTGINESSDAKNGDREEKSESSSVEWRDKQQSALKYARRGERNDEVNAVGEAMVVVGIDEKGTTRNVDGEEESKSSSVKLLKNQQNALKYASQRERSGKIPRRQLTTKPYTINENANSTLSNQKIKREMTNENKSTWESASHEQIRAERQASERELKTDKIGGGKTKELQALNKPLESNKAPNDSHNLMPSMQDEQLRGQQQQKPQQSIYNTQLSQQSRYLKSTMETKRTKQQIEELQMGSEEQPQAQSKHAAEKSGFLLELKSQHIPAQLTAEGAHDAGMESKYAEQEKVWFNANASKFLDYERKSNKMRTKVELGSKELKAVIEQVKEPQVQLVRRLVRNQTYRTSKQDTKRNEQKKRQLKATQVIEQGGAEWLVKNKNLQGRNKTLQARNAGAVTNKPHNAAEAKKTATIYKQLFIIQFQHNNNTANNAKVNKSFAKKNAKHALFEQLKKEKFVVEENGQKLRLEAKSDEMPAETRNEESKQKEMKQEAKSENSSMDLPKIALKYASERHRSDKVAVMSEAALVNGIIDRSNAENVDSEQESEKNSERRLTKQQSALKYASQFKKSEKGAAASAAAVEIGISENSYNNSFDKEEENDRSSVVLTKKQQSALRYASKRERSDILAVTSEAVKIGIREKSYEKNNCNEMKCERSSVELIKQKESALKYARKGERNDKLAVTTKVALEIGNNNKSKSVRSAIESQRLNKHEAFFKETEAIASAEGHLQRASQVNKSKEIQGINISNAITAVNVAHKQNNNKNGSNNNNNNDSNNNINNNDNKNNTSSSNYSTNKNERNKIQTEIKRQRAMSSHGGADVVENVNGVENSLIVLARQEHRFITTNTSLSGKISSASSKHETTRLTTKRQGVQPVNKQATQNELDLSNATEITTTKLINEQQNCTLTTCGRFSELNNGTKAHTTAAPTMPSAKDLVHSTTQIEVMDELGQSNRAENNWEHTNLPLPPLGGEERAESETVADWQQQEQLAAIYIRRPDMRTGEALKLNDTLLSGFNRESEEKPEEIMQQFTTQKSTKESERDNVGKEIEFTTKEVQADNERVAYEADKRADGASIQQQQLRNETKGSNSTRESADESLMRTMSVTHHFSTDNESENYTESALQTNIYTARNYVSLKEATTTAKTKSTKIFEETANSARPPTTEIAQTTKVSFLFTVWPSMSATKKVQQMLKQQTNNTTEKYTSNNLQNNADAEAVAVAEGNDYEGVTEATLRTALKPLATTTTTTNNTTPATAAGIPTAATALLTTVMQPHTNATILATTIPTRTTTRLENRTEATAEESAFFVLPNFMALTTTATTIKAPTTTATTIKAPTTPIITTKEYSLLTRTPALLYTTTTTINTPTAATAAPTGASWPVKHASVMEGDVILGGLMMVHSREDSITCGPIMPQGGIQAIEAMLYTLDQVNKQQLLPNITLGAHILDDCDKDTYGLEMAVDFIKGECNASL